MDGASIANCFPWAVHVSDSVLTGPWLLGGFALAALLVLAAAYRVRDEEIPRIALLTAAFFVASLLHVTFGPTSVHLLLNGLVGVILGRRAALAILVGLALQMALFGHGGWTTLGINTCVLTLPALLAGGLFAVLHRVRALRQPWFRTVLMTVCALVWLLSLVFSVLLLLNNRWTSLDHVDLASATRGTLHPATLTVAVLLSLVVAWLERRLENTPDFPLGLLLGMVTVLTTLFLNALVLLLGGAEDWHTLVLVGLIFHLPIAVLEGVVLGFTVSFLLRVKPDLLGPAMVWTEREPKPQRVGERHRSRDALPSSVPLLVLLTILLAAAPAQAHRLDADYTVLPEGKIRLESWFDSGAPPRGAKVKVARPDGTLFTQGKLDERGHFVFALNRAEELIVVVDAGAGHRKEITIPPVELKRTVPPMPPSASVANSAPAAPRGEVPIKDVLIGVGFLLALAAFVLSVRTARAVRQLQHNANDSHQ